MINQEASFPEHLIETYWLDEAATARWLPGVRQREREREGLLLVGERWAKRGGGRRERRGPRALRLPA